MAIAFGRSIIGSSIISTIFSLSGCATSPPPLPQPPALVGQEWPPFRKAQVALASEEGGAAWNQAGMVHVLTRMEQEDLSQEEDEQPSSHSLGTKLEDTRNPCRELRLKIEDLERCSVFSGHAFEKCLNR